MKMEKLKNWLINNKIASNYIAWALLLTGLGLIGMQFTLSIVLAMLSYTWQITELLLVYTGRHKTTFLVIYIVLSIMTILLWTDYYYKCTQ